MLSWRLLARITLAEERERLILLFFLGSGFDAEASFQRNPEVSAVGNMNLAKKRWKFQQKICLFINRFFFVCLSI